MLLSLIPWPLIPEYQEVLLAICPAAFYLDLKGLVSSRPHPLLQVPAAWGLWSELM